MWSILKWRMPLKLRMLISADLIVSVGVVFLTSYFVPKQVSNTLCKDLYAVGISVLSIIFSVFFAALALIMSTSSDEFVTFLEEHKLFSLLLWGYKFTIWLLLIALLASLTLYSITSFWLSQSPAPLTQNRTLLLVFELLFLWGITATASAVFAAIKYSHKRSDFLLSVKTATKSKVND